jgi:uncharacterized protein YbjT (DUF2867 family)
MKTILVIGATGAQGGSVAKALLTQGKYAVRILTRQPNSEKALALKAAGASVFEGDLDNIESLKTAMKNCYGVFGVTNFWEHFQGEFQQGKNLIDSAKMAGIQHFLLHTLPNYGSLSNGKYPTPHCDIKAALKEYAQSQNIPASFIEIAFYYENFFSFFPPQRGIDGNYSFGFPQGDTKLAMVSIEDLGGVVASIFESPDKYIGRTVGVVGADESCSNYANTMSQVLQKNINYVYVPHDVYATYDFPGAGELANMFEVQRLYITDRHKDMIETYSLNPNTQSFENWLKKNKNKFDTYFEQLESTK